MADRKISDLTALTAPASGDYLPIVDISESAAASKNKRITIEELMRGAPDGTAAAPSIAFESDPNTGIYSPGADQVAISTNGTGRLFVDSSGNVGIGTTGPQSLLNISTGSTAGDQTVLTCGTAATGLTGSHALYLGAYGSTQYGSKIKSIYNYSASLSTNLSFEISNSAGTLTEAARIDSSGRLLIGTSTTSAASTLVLQGYNGNSTDFSILRACVGTATPADGGVLGRIAFGDSAHSDGAWVEGYRDGGTWSGASKPSRLVFSVTADGAASPTEALRISNDRSITVSDGGNVVLGTTTGTKIGTGTTQKIGFYNATPVVQPTAVADATDAATVITQLNALLTRMRNLGLIAT
jgi:hypothetical protein